MGVGDLDKKVVGSIGAGVSGVSQILNSIGGRLEYILVIALYAYIIYSRWGKNSP